MADAFFQNLAALLVNAVEVGLTVELNETQKRKYSEFLAQLKHILGEYEDAQRTLEIMQKRPESKGSKILFQEELEELITLSPAKKQAIVELAKAFLAEVNTQEVITQHGKYITNMVQAKGIIIGDSNSVNQSF